MSLSPRKARRDRPSGRVQGAPVGRRDGSPSAPAADAPAAGICDAFGADCAQELVPAQAGPSDRVSTAAGSCIDGGNGAGAAPGWAPLHASVSDSLQETQQRLARALQHAMAALAECEQPPARKLPPIPTAYSPAALPATPGPSPQLPDAASPVPSNAGAVRDKFGPAEPTFPGASPDGSGSDTSAAHARRATAQLFTSASAKLHSNFDAILAASRRAGRGSSAAASLLHFPSPTASGSPASPQPIASSSPLLHHHSGGSAPPTASSPAQLEQAAATHITRARMQQSQSASPQRACASSSKLHCSRELPSGAERRSRSCSDSPCSHGGPHGGPCYTHLRDRIASVDEFCVASSPALGLEPSSPCVLHGSSSPRAGAREHAAPRPAGALARRLCTVGGSTVAAAGRASPLQQTAGVKRRHVAGGSPAKRSSGTAPHAQRPVRQSLAVPVIPSPYLQPTSTNSRACPDGRSLAQSSSFSAWGGGAVRGSSNTAQPPSLLLAAARRTGSAANATATTQPHGNVAVPAADEQRRAHAGQPQRPSGSAATAAAAASAARVRFHSAAGRAVSPPGAGPLCEAAERSRGSSVISIDRLQHRDGERQRKARRPKPRLGTYQLVVSSSLLNSPPSRG